MKEMHYLELLSHVEEIISGVIRRCYPTSWDENHITFSIADDLARDLKSVRVEGFDRPFKTTWDARKMTGNVEQALGDLAVIIRLKSWSGEELNGVGVLEAKRRDKDRVVFSAFRKKQLETILRSTPSSRLLLYDYSQVTDFGDNLRSSETWFDAEYTHKWQFAYRGLFPMVPYSHCLTVPTGIPLTTGIKTTALYKYGLPFSIQLCGRYLRGLDLEYCSTAVSKVRDFVNRSGGPRNLLLVGVSTGDAEPELPGWVSEEFYGRGV